MRRKMESRGFTLIELVVTMAVIAILLGTVMKNTSGMLTEGNISKTEGELQSLKSAVTSYWKNNNGVYPTDIHNSLVNASPQLLSQKLIDPFHTDTVNATYGYTTGTDATFGVYFIVYTKGARADTLPSWDATNQRVTYTGSGTCISNAPVIKY